ncbi:MAG: hypothetical protein WC483_05480 [Candidatus Paceibacterota bacterium]
MTEAWRWTSPSAGLSLSSSGRSASSSGRQDPARSAAERPLPTRAHCALFLWRSSDAEHTSATGNRLERRNRARIRLSGGRRDKVSAIESAFRHGRLAKIRGFTARQGRDLRFVYLHHAESGVRPRRSGIHADRRFRALSHTGGHLSERGEARMNTRHLSLDFSIVDIQSCRSVFVRVY